MASENQILKSSPTTTASSSDKTTGMKYLLIDISQLYFIEYSESIRLNAIAQVQEI